MKKLLGFVFAFLIASMSVFASDMRIVQIDGMFFDGADESLEKIENIIHDINRQKNIEFVVFTGNNIAKPDRELLVKFLDSAKHLNYPYYVVLGNKDVNRQKNLSKTEYVKILSNKVKSHKKIASTNFVIDKKDVVFIIVDGAKDVIPSSMGYYKAETLKWLSEQLNFYKNKNVVLIQHFPIIPPSKRESHYTYKADEYLKLISEHKNVKAVISGHFNVNKEITSNGVLHINTAEAPNYRIIDIIDCNTETPVFWSTIRN